jgi:hypothetical protein
MRKIAIFGAGGFGREVKWLIDDINAEKPTWNFIGFLVTIFLMLKTLALIISWEEQVN